MQSAPATTCPADTKPKAYDVVHVDDEGKRNAYIQIATSTRAAEDIAIQRFGMPRLLRAWRLS